VLAGLIGGLISRGYKLGDACKLSIFIHGGAGAYLDLSHLDGMGVNASTILGALSSTLRSLASSHDS
jgi:NAD(P)H-hydrate repair Nnr-like enzyme with NAD(P)H-hydrate dehydratase domain